jgi:hypothetical protein
MPLLRGHPGIGIGPPQNCGSVTMAINKKACCEDDALRSPIRLSDADDDAMNPKYILLAVAACWIAIFLIIAAIWLIRVHFFIAHD